MQAKRRVRGQPERKLHLQLRASDDDGGIELVARAYRGCVAGYKAPSQMFGRNSASRVTNAKSLETGSVQDRKMLTRSSSRCMYSCMLLMLTWYTTN